MSDLDDAIRTMIRRATLVSTDDTGAQQRMKVRGLRGEELDKVLRIQPFGDTSVPPPGAEALILALGGRTDRSVVIGFEHPDVRPRNLDVGDRVIYDGHGNAISLVKAKMRIVHSDLTEIAVGSALIRLKKDGTVEINP